MDNGGLDGALLLYKTLVLVVVILILLIILGV